MRLFHRLSLLLLSLTLVAAGARPADLGIARSRGERPRPPDSGVVDWTDGDRDGGGLREMAVEEQGSSPASVEPARLPGVPLLRPLRHRAGLAEPAVPSRVAWDPRSDRGEGEPSSPSPVRPSVRLLTGRLNE